jgi:hypothetical protein
MNSADTHAGGIWAGGDLAGVDRTVSDALGSGKARPWASTGHCARRGEAQEPRWRA